MMTPGEYPRHVHKAGGSFKQVDNDKEKAAALKDGWSLQPIVDKVPAKAATEAPAFPSDPE